METSYWAHHEGEFFWGVRAPLAPGDIFLWADRVEVRDGCLLFFGPDSMLNASFAPGQWSVVFHARFSYEDPFDIFSVVREDGIFRVDTAGTMTILARTTQRAPVESALPFFRFSDPNTSGGMMVAFRAPIGFQSSIDPDALPTGVFLVDPQAAISAIALQGDTLDGVRREEAERFALASQRALQEGNVEAAREAARIAMRYLGNIPLATAPEAVLEIAELAK